MSYSAPWHTKGRYWQEWVWDSEVAHPGTANGRTPAGFFFNVHESFTYMYASVPYVYLVAMESRRQHTVLWNKAPDSCEPATMWVLGVKLRTSERAASIFNC